VFALLLELGGGQPREAYAVEASGLDFEIRNGRLYYDDFTLLFVKDKFDIKFYGSVGFDDTLDLTVSLPIGAELLRRLKVRGPVREYVRLLAGTRVDIPMVGTRQRPMLDFSKVDTKKLLESVIKKQGIEGIGGILDRLGGGRKKD
jgi:hypothetical protein